ncbi:MAG: hypothetical protein BMS9Abin31_0152 [Gammaproteobacteria bacterium]|nr:MAG: hypothetical protein BMS9Abin31_0152 [Gammaproteobacteria bacterium]
MSTGNEQKNKEQEFTMSATDAARIANNLRWVTIGVGVATTVLTLMCYFIYGISENVINIKVEQAKMTATMINNGVNDTDHKLADNQKFRDINVQLREIYKRLK